MVTRKLQLLLLLCVFGFSSSMVAQKVIKKANKQFELRAYEKALTTYHKALADFPENNVVKLQIAECLRRTNLVLESQNWYKTAITGENVPGVYNLYYGHLLKSIADYDNAAIYYEKYGEIDAAVAEHFTVSCDFAKNLMMEQSDYELILDDCNSKMSDLAPRFYGEDMIFTSFRENDVVADIHGCKLYTKQPGVESVALRSPIKIQYGLGFVSYAKDIELCAFSKSNMKNTHEPVSEKDEDHAIYLAQVVEGGDFIDEVPFKYNEVNSSTAFPHLAFDGKALYFASNRQGGFGGYDLYVSYFKDNDWTAPENLGPTINSVGNEISPFFDGKELYFASDFHAGMGGYDLFHSDVVMGEWTFPINLGNGINSPGDDYFPVIQSGTNRLYFSSNRLGGRGGDDIYYGIPTSKEPLYSINEIYNESQVPAAIKLDAVYTPSTLDGPMDASQNASIQLVSNSDVTTIKVLTDESEIEDPKVSEVVLNMVGEKNTTNDDTNHEVIVDNTLVDNEPRDEIAVVQEIAPMQANTVNQSQTREIMKATTVEVEPANYDNIAISEKEKNAIPVLHTPVTEKVPEKHPTRLDTEDITIEQTMEIVQTTSDKPSATKLITEVPGSRPISQDISMTGARRVSFGDLLPAVNNVYFIQLASLTQSKGNVADYKSLIKYGNIYKMYKSYSTKIKLGYFVDKNEAKRVLKNVKAQGFRDAFITTDPLSTGEMELFIAGKEYDYNGANYSTPRNQGTKYKVRLASYEDPIWFDIKSAKELGEIEQWTKGTWTIFILSGFRDVEEAHKAKIRAINRGFADAEVVIDNGGILERIRTN